MARHTDNDQLNVIVNGRIDDISYAVVSKKSARRRAYRGNANKSSKARIQVTCRMAMSQLW